MGIFIHFGMENYVWKDDKDQKSLWLKCFNTLKNIRTVWHRKLYMKTWYSSKSVWISSVFLVWLFGAKIFQYPPIVCYYFLSINIWVYYVIFLIISGKNFSKIKAIFWQKRKNKNWYVFHLTKNNRLQTRIPVTRKLQIYEKLCHLYKV